MRSNRRNGVCMVEDAQALEELYGLRLLAPGVAELAISIGAGLIVAALAGFVLSLAQTRRAQMPIADRVVALRRLPDADRTVVLASLLQALTDRIAPGPGRWMDRAVERLNIDGEMMEALSDALYRPSVSFDPSALEQAVIAATRKVEG